MNSRLVHPRKILLPVFLIYMVITANPVLAETVGYVSDQLTVAMRSGATNEHRILKFLSSGAQLKVLESSEDGNYKLVEISDGKSGWMRADSIMDAPGGRELLEEASQKLQVSDQKVKQLSKTIVQLKSEISGLKNEVSVLQDERITLTNSMEALNITAANPLAISKKNKQLKIELKESLANEVMLENDNKELRSNVMQEWFIIGSAVSIGCLILGIILTRINWRRKRSSWGDGF